MKRGLKNLKVIENALGEVRKMLVLSKVFITMIDGVLVFLVAFLLFLLIKIPWYLSVIPFVIYILVYGRKRILGIRYTQVERVVPELNEKLRTAADNVGKDNEVVEALNKEVLMDMKKIRTSLFFGSKSNMKKLGCMGVLAFMVILVASFDVEIFDFVTLGKSRLDDENFLPTQKNIGVFIDEGDDDIYGDESIIEYGNDEILIGLNTVEGNRDLSQRKELEKKNFASSYQEEKEIYATSDSSFSENIAKENQEVVKKYFNQITQG
ncbi:MAG TPA: hypothetical protein VJC07_01480 [Candidatus Nanoarchaeia archaeon]|nr:hypothetical protein [Candidatus Nanoarchaeia archaeon]